MSMQAIRTRLARTSARLLSPKRLFATLAAIAFVLLYVINGFLVILTRRPADLDALTLWLSGAMAVYAMFHFIRSAWQDPEPRLGLSPAQTLWIARAPISNRVLVLYRIAGIVPSTLFKSLLVSVVLLCDVQSPLRLFVALFLAMFVLEAIRIIADLFTSSLSDEGRVAMKTAMSAIGAALLFQLLARAATVFSGSLHPVALINGLSSAAGETASCEMIQWLALPWWSMTQLATASRMNVMTLGYALLSFAIAGLAIIAVIAVDRWSAWHDEWVESDRLIANRRGVNMRGSRWNKAQRVRHTLWRLPKWTGAGPLIARQWVSVVRYRGTIFISLFIPAVLSLAPLLSGHQTGLLHVTAWLAVSTFLLAPPALKIDFRRDIDRMWLLKSMPMTPLAMTIGQVFLPTLITIVFQVVVIAIACVVTKANTAAVVLAIGGLAGFALFSFAVENALFLTFPHRPKQEGLAMMVRTKLIFLGKGLLLALFGGLFIAWVSVCSTMQWNLLVLVGVSVLSVWSLAGIATAVTARCWKRFDMRLDTPL